MTNLVLVLTTVSDEQSGDSIANALVAERLAACVNIGAPITSVYWWQGQLTREGERQLVIKTTVDRIAAVKARLLALHPYELPEVLVIPVIDGSEGYLGWVSSATAADPAGGARQQ
jgi:periplasmic divalent cation tolerance protein